MLFSFTCKSSDDLSHDIIITYIFNDIYIYIYIHDCVC